MLYLPILLITLKVLRIITPSIITNIKGIYYWIPTA